MNYYLYTKIYLNLHGNYMKMRLRSSFFICGSHGLLPGECFIYSSGRLSFGGTSRDPLAAAGPRSGGLSSIPWSPGESAGSVEDYVFGG